MLNPQNNGNENDYIINLATAKIKRDLQEIEKIENELRLIRRDIKKE